MNMASQTPKAETDEVDGGLITINPAETSSATEKAETFGDPEHQAKILHNAQFQQDMAERKKYAEAAFKLTRLWVWFLIGSTGVQMFLSIWGFGLSEAMFVTLLTTTTVSVLGVWALVGQYLFAKPKR